MQQSWAAAGANPAWYSNSQGLWAWTLPLGGTSCDGQGCVGAWSGPVLALGVSTGLPPIPHPLWPLTKPGATPVLFTEQMKVPPSCGLQGPTPAHFGPRGPLLVPQEAEAKRNFSWSPPDLSPELLAHDGEPCWRGSAAPPFQAGRLCSQNDPLVSSSASSWLGESQLPHP